MLALQCAIERETNAKFIAYKVLNGIRVDV
jgi:hypothetical protein